MTAGSPLRGLVRHCALALRLNFRSRQAVAYGYLMPVLFLVAFAGIFRGDSPVLEHEMGQLLTITLMGGACFGMPTTLVAERDRGLWRRYRLLPGPTGRLLAGTVATRLLLVGSAAALQILLARVAYGTPLPLHPGQALAAFLAAAGAFLGLGVLIASLADDVPAVQALGQCLFLPMILLGGVGVPLAVLPGWAQKVAGFMPGRYAVEVIERATGDTRGLRGEAFALAALVLIGAAAGVAGSRLFRWDPGPRAGRFPGAWVAAALLAWIAVGAAAGATGRLRPVTPGEDAYQAITGQQIDALTYDDLPGDNELATRLAPPFGNTPLPEDLAAFAGRLDAWAPGRIEDHGQAVRNLLSVASNADVTANLREAEIARLVFNTLRARFASQELEQILAWIVLDPDAGTVVRNAPELHLRRTPTEAILRERNALYARKLLGRLVGALPD